MKKTIVLSIFLSVFLMACGTQQTTQNNTPENMTKIGSTTNDSTTDKATDIKDEGNGIILFYGDYVLDGSAPPQEVVYDRIIFYPDGKCYAHRIYEDGKERGYYSYYYSYCEKSGKIGIGAENASFWEAPTMSEHRNILAFENYALKLVEE